ncbi:TPA: hypothetical protein ACWXNU_000001, partial [Escherichia coli]
GGHLRYQYWLNGYIRQSVYAYNLTAVAAGEQVVLASELAAAMTHIKELQRLLGKKTMEN